ncbi:MAG: diadenylate cyclase CdaA [Bryobacteraceae bacterium]
MPLFYSPLLSSIPKLSPIAILDILAVAFLIYQFIMIVRGRRAAHILTGIAILVLVYLVAVWTRMELLRSILAALAPYTAFGLIVMFQSELRRMLARIGRNRFLGLGRRLDRREVNEELLLALAQMSQAKIGALIVIERKIGLRTFIESGVMLDAFVSRDLLCVIFQRGGALHDGAAILQGDRIVAAACFLPLTTNPIRSAELGTRHRAAIGITEETDCISLVVSEETGRLSIAAYGEIETDVSLRRVEERLSQFANDKSEPPALPPGPPQGEAADVSAAPEWKQAKHS